jgi:hypothetical protein
VVVAAQGVADVMQQRADHVLLVAAVTPGTAGGLQAWAQAVDGEAAKVTVEQKCVRRMRRQLAGVGAEVIGDDQSRRRHRACG